VRSICTNPAHQDQKAYIEDLDINANPAFGRVYIILNAFRTRNPFESRIIILLATRQSFRHDCSRAITLLSEPRLSYLPPVDDIFCRQQLRPVNALMNQLRMGRRSAYDTCRRRKLRCDGQQPCGRCERSGTQCTFGSGQNRIQPLHWLEILSSKSQNSGVSYRH
jgi:hypothetical protein